MPVQQEMMLTPFQGNISLQENVAYGQVGVESEINIVVL